MKIFVYGTLMRGNSNYDYYLSESEFLIEGYIENYQLYDLGYYPGIKNSIGNKVKGEVFEIDENKKREIDRLEGEGYLYTATKVSVITEFSIIDATAYVYNREVYENQVVSYQNQPWRKK